MAVKFYPPIVSGTLPSFSKNEDGTVLLTVPFTMNNMVAVSEVEGLILRIKTTTTNAILTTTKNTNGKAAFEDNEGVFKLTEEEGAHLVVGQSYKFQLAYYKGGQIGYYSNLAIIKCTDAIGVAISNLALRGSSNANKFHLIGKYTNKDTSEKVYQYKFQLFNNNVTEELETSGWLNHNVYADDGSGSSIDEYDVRYNMQAGNWYKAVYTIRTNTYKEVSSAEYPLSVGKATYSSILSGLPKNVRPIVAKLNFDNAYIKVKIGGGLERTLINRYITSLIDEDKTRVLTGEDFLPDEIYTLMKVFQYDETVLAGETVKKYLQNIKKYNAIATQNSNISFMRGFITAMFEDDAKKLPGETYLQNFVKKIDSLTVSGTFILERANSTDGFTHWDTIWKRDNLNELKANDTLFTDYFVEQGVNYIYSLREINSFNVFSERDLTDVITADYEDTFLYDGHRQLRLRFNVDVPKLSRVLSEQKKNMIGSKYPFIFRNGVIDYKEFQLKGMMTFYNDNDNDTTEPYDETELIDPKSIFIDKSTIYKRETLYQDQSGLSTSYADSGARNDYGSDWNYITETEMEQYQWKKPSYENYRANSSIDLDNSYLERICKLEVMHWLSDGKVKLFKSSQEGLYLIRLMNVSISPSAKLGGLIHSFDSTAEEIGSVTNFDDAKYYGLLPDDDIISNVTVSTTTHSVSYSYKDIGKPLNTGGKIFFLQITNAIPGTTFILTKKDGSETSVMIGATGQFELDCGEESDDYLTSIRIEDTEENKEKLLQLGNNDSQLILIESTSISTSFDDIVTEEYIISAAQAVSTIGLGGTNILEQFNLSVEDNDEIYEKMGISEVSYLKFEKMGVTEISNFDILKSLAEKELLASSIIYHVTDGDQYVKISYTMPQSWKHLKKEGDHLYRVYEDEQTSNPASLIDDYYFIVEGEGIDYSIVIDAIGEDGSTPVTANLDMTYAQEYLYDTGDIKSVVVGNGVLVEGGFNVKINELIYDTKPISASKETTPIELFEEKISKQKNYLVKRLNLQSLADAGEEPQQGMIYLTFSGITNAGIAVDYSEATGYDTADLYQSAKTPVASYRELNTLLAEYYQAEEDYKSALASAIHNNIGSGDSDEG